MLFLRYLSDCHDDLKLGAVEQWEAGNLTLATETEIRARMGTIKEIADLPFEAIELFYNQIDQMNAADGGEGRIDEV